MIQHPYEVFQFELDPIENFLRVFACVEKMVVKDPNAMSLATVSKDGFPSQRTVLFKGLIRGGFTFFSNYQSSKAKDMEIHPQVSLLFFWPTLEMQIKIKGAVEKISEAESEAYFSSRPRLSQIGAWASKQSSVIPNFDYLQEKVLELEKKYQDQVIPKPPHWGGYRVEPTMMEFWFGRMGRLHERYVFERNSPHDSWERYLKSP
jgi:pyridoxamine 5'-phosphate oxidase